MYFDIYFIYVAAIDPFYDWILTFSNIFIESSPSPGQD